MRCLISVTDEHIDTAENLDIIMPMYNFIEYSNNYSDTSGSLWQLKKDEFSMKNAENPISVSINNSLSFKHKASILEIQVAINNAVLKKIKKNFGVIFGDH